MKNVKLKNTDYVSSYPYKYDDYVNCIKVILEHTDEVCFTVYPCSHDLEKFCAGIDRSLWASLSENLLYTTCDKTIVNPQGKKCDLIIMKNNDALAEFFLERENMFDFEEYDPEFDIALEDPVFIKNGEVVCYTLSHEEECYVAEDVYEKMEIMEDTETNYVECVLNEHESYIDCIKTILEHTDEVQFSVTPFFDDPEDLIECVNKSNWKFMGENEIFVAYGGGMMGDEDLENLIIMEKNDDVVKFFLEKKDMFDFEEKDAKSGIVLKNPSFFKENNLICYTVTSEASCFVSEDLYEKIKS